MNSLFRRDLGCIAAMFHDQVIDLFRHLLYGAFFANPAQGLVAAGSRTFPEPPCTDLSTDDVDKAQSLSKTGTCARFV
jgi:hypothetical protein